MLARTQAPGGALLYAAAARGGAQALAQPAGAIAAGRRADLVVLDPDIRRSPAAVDDVLDAAIFGPCRQPVRDVMVAGRWVVREGRHPDEATVPPPIGARSRGRGRRLALGIVTRWTLHACISQWRRRR